MRVKRICWVTGETDIWDGHCPSSLPKPQTLWQQENQSVSDQGLCNPAPGRASVGGGSGLRDRVHFRGETRPSCMLQAGSCSKLQSQ